MFRPQVPPNSKATDIQDNLQTLIFVHLGLTIMKMVIWGFGSGFEDIFACMFLYCGLKRIDFCMVLMYIFSLVSMLFAIFVSLGFYWQNGINDGAPDPEDAETPDIDGDMIKT